MRPRFENGTKLSDLESQFSQDWDYGGLSLHLLQVLSSIGYTIRYPPQFSRHDESDSNLGSFIFLDTSRRGFDYTGGSVGSLLKNSRWIQLSLLFLLLAYVV